MCIRDRATAGTGTALGVIRELFRRGQLSAVYADETRPVLQGARLTSSELRKEGIPSIRICDDMAVSYTHLDVYKRQVISWSGKLAQGAWRMYIWPKTFCLTGKWQ